MGLLSKEETAESSVPLASIPPHDLPEGPEDTGTPQDVSPQQEPSQQAS